MKNFLALTYILSFTWAIGLQGLTIPRNGLTLGTAGTGIAGSLDPSLNPAMEVQDFSHIQFSMDRWLGEINGSQAAFSWGREIPKYLSIRTLNAEDLELWGNNPEDKPMGSFAVNFVSASFGASHDFNTPYRFGMRIESNYSHLFTESLYGFTLDMGMNTKLSDNIQLGAVIQHLGIEKTNGLQAELPLTIGLGAAFQLAALNTSLFSDIKYSADHGPGLHGAINTNWKFINFRAGAALYENQKSTAAGFSFQYRRWKLNYGVYFHENTILGLPQFMDIRYTL